MSKSRSLSIALLSIVALTSVLTACGSTNIGGSTTGGGSTTNGPTATNTPAPATKPTSLPKVDAAFCGRILTLGEATSIMGKQQATNIRVVGDDEGGSCNYEYSAAKSVVSIALFPGATGVDAIANNLKSNPNFAGTVTTVNGVGDDARFVVNPIPNTTIVQDHLFVIYGAVLFDCFDPNVTVDNDTELNKLKQVIQLALSRI